MDLLLCSMKGRSSFSRSATTAQLSLQLRIFPPCTLNVLIRRVRESHKVPPMRLNFICYCRLDLQRGRGPPSRSVTQKPGLPGFGFMADDGQTGSNTTVYEPLGPFPAKVAFKRDVQ